MSAHRVPHELYEAAFTHNNEIPDPGASGTIVANKSPGVCKIVTAGVEARTLAPPAGPGMLLAVCFVEDGGDMTLTVTNGYDQAGSTSLTFDDVGEHALFFSVQIDDDGTDDYEWRLVANDGAAGGSALGPIPQAGAAQAAVTPTTAITGTDTVDEAATLAAIQAVETLANGLRTALIAANIITGAA